MHLFNAFCRKSRLGTHLAEKTMETVYIDETGHVVRAEEFNATVLYQNLPDGISLEMIEIPGGYFSMGSAHARGFPDEEPRHNVHIQKFFISRTTITQNQWKAVMKKLPPCRGNGPEFPVDRVSWHKAQLFCGQLTKMTGQKYRLPAEAEWEYACRGGSMTNFCFGNMITTDFCNYVGLHPYKDGPAGVYRHGPVQVASFPGNRFGVYDMHGNLWEWCMDTWHENYTGAPLNGEAWVRGGSAERVARGGSWHDPPDLCRSASRMKFIPTEGEDYVGVRVVLSQVDDA